MIRGDTRQDRVAGVVGTQIEREREVHGQLRIHAVVANVKEQTGRAGFHLIEADQAMNGVGINFENRGSAGGKDNGAADDDGAGASERVEAQRSNLSIG